MKKDVVVVLATLALGCATQPPARPLAPAAPIPAEMQKLAFYVGEWDCEGVDTTPGAAAKKEALHVSVTRQLEGAWLAVAVSDEHGAVTTELKGFDPKAGRFRHLWAIRDGQSGSLTSTGGWDNEQIVLEEDHPAPASITRMVFTKIDDQHFTHREDTNTGKGFVPAYLKSCHKVAGNR